MTVDDEGRGTLSVDLETTATWAAAAEFSGDRNPSALGRHPDGCIAVARLLAKAEEALDRAICADTPAYGRTLLVETASSYMELAARHR